MCVCVPFFFYIIDFRELFIDSILSVSIRASECLEPETWNRNKKIGSVVISSIYIYASRCRIIITRSSILVALSVSVRFPRCGADC